MKKALFISIIFSIVLIGAGCQKTEQVVQDDYKWVNLWVTPGFLNFQVPADWNAYRVDEAVYKEGIWNQEEITGSVSAADSPVGFKFFNWEQIDFIYSNQNLLTEEFVENVRNSEIWEWDTFEELTLSNFTGYVGTQKVEEDGEPSKGYPGGQVYYLNHKSDDQGTVLIWKHTKGDEDFNNGFQKILETIDITDSYK